MNTKFVKPLLIVTAVVALLGAALPAVQAQAAVVVPDKWQKTSQTFTVTQDQINSSYRVTNPRDRQITDVSVTVEDGQVSVAATLTKPGKDPIATVSIWKPIIRAGLINWQFVSATANGQPVTPDLKLALIRLHQVALHDVVWSIVRHNAPIRIFATSVTCTPGLITITANVWENVPPATATPAPTTSA